MQLIAVQCISAVSLLHYLVSPQGVVVVIYSEADAVRRSLTLLICAPRTLMKSAEKTHKTTVAKHKSKNAQVATVLLH